VTAPKKKVTTNGKGKASGARQPAAAAPVRRSKAARVPDVQSPEAGNSQRRRSVGVELEDRPAPFSPPNGEGDHTVRLTVEVSAFGKRDQIEREAIRGMSRHLAQTYGSGRAVLRVGRRRIEIYDEDTASTVIDLRDGGGR